MLTTTPQAHVDNASKKLYNTAKLCYKSSTCDPQPEPAATNTRESELNQNADVIYRQFLMGEKNSADWLTAREIAVKELPFNLTQAELDRWKLIIESKNSKELWEKIDWKGEVNQISVITYHPGSPLQISSCRSLPTQTVMRFSSM